MEIYVVGIPQAGGVWLANEYVFASRKEAEAKLAEFWPVDKKLSECQRHKVFTLEVKPQRENSFFELMADSLHCNKACKNRANLGSGATALLIASANITTY